jgi:hypothetical protein
MSHLHRRRETLHERLQVISVHIDRSAGDMEKVVRPE